MSLDQLLNIRRPTAKLLVILLGSVEQRRLMNTTNKPARLAVSRSSVKNSKMVSADAKQEGET